ncbi:hypothetical protein QBC34DRAFT_403156 [Podospora aff. communis PSN243]|uniref:Uncharacterized protein n=1 Tax=Podospora aff. communis PSN243 TaxID=3040156 RepID=A0AAV9GRG3_9PEZI|nr:hypothetical protein QBC34DRAFT_403156 [Podospora aff. communis PSN243]
MPDTYRGQVILQRMQYTDELKVYREPLPTAKHKRRLKWYTTALLCTNRQVCAEAVPILYSQHEFVVCVRNQSGIAHLTKLESFLTSIGSVNAGYLTTVQMTFPRITRIEHTEDGTNVVAQLNGIPSLRSVFLEDTDEVADGVMEIMRGLGWNPLS